jgi:predicted MFS family arabinose efflux permease
VAGFLQERSGYSILSTAAVLPAAAAIILMSILLPKAPLVQAKPKRPRDFLGYGDLAGRPEMLLLGVLRFLPTYGYGIAGIFVPLVLRSAGASNTFIALYATVSSLSASAAQLIVGRIADTYNWKWPTIGSFLVLALGSLTIALFPASLVAVFLGAVALIAAAWALATLMPTLVSKVAKPEEQGRVLSFAHLFWNLAMISGSVSGGFLYQAHPGFPFAAGALAAAAAMLAAARFFRLADSAIAAAKKEA